MTGQTATTSPVVRPSRRRFAPPQDEVVTSLMALQKFLILRSPRSGRLEGRRVPIPARGKFCKSLAPRERALCGSIRLSRQVEMGERAVDMRRPHRPGGAHIGFVELLIAGDAEQRQTDA